MQEILLKIIYFERGQSKTLKKVNFIFLSNQVPFNGKSSKAVFELFQKLNLKIYASQFMTS